MKYFSQTSLHASLLLGVAVASTFVVSSMVFLPLCNAADGNCDIEVGDTPIHAAVLYSSEFYVVNQGDDTVSVINTDTNTVTNTINVGSLPSRIVLSGTGMFVSNIFGNSVSVIDVTTQTVDKTITGLDNPIYMAASSTGVFLVNQGEDEVVVIDNTTNTIDRTIAVGSSPGRIVASGTGVFVINQSSNTVSVIDVTTLTVDRTISVGNGPNDIAASGTGIFVANFSADTVSVIDRRLNSVVATVSVGDGPSFVTVNGEHAYVTNQSAHTVSAIHIPSRTVVATVATQNYPYGIASYDDYVYAMNYVDDTVTVIDATSNTLVRHIAVGDTPVFIVFPDTTGYVMNYGTNTVSAIDTATNTALTQCTPICGNGEIGDDEECDDGNATGRDGCSASCTIEAGFTCTGEPSICAESCTAGVAEGAAASKRYANSCFAFYDEDLNYSNASASCVAHGGTLAIVNSASEQTLLASIGSFAWIGLSDLAVEGTFVWADGTSLGYENWADGQPEGGGDENCVRFENGSLWHDYPCADNYWYFCEIPDTGPVSVSVTTTTRTRQNGGLRASTLQNKISTVAQSQPHGMSRASPALSANMTVAPRSRTFETRTCSRVMKWFANHETILGRVNARLLKSFGFTCGG